MYMYTNACECIKSAVRVHVYMHIYTQSLDFYNGQHLIQCCLTMNSGTCDTADVVSNGDIDTVQETVQTNVDSEDLYEELDEQTTEPPPYEYIMSGTINKNYTSCTTLILVVCISPNTNQSFLHQTGQNPHIININPAYSVTAHARYTLTEEHLIDMAANQTVYTYVST